jgi:hypothetical protein
MNRSQNGSSLSPRYKRSRSNPRIHHTKVIGTHKGIHHQEERREGKQNSRNSIEYRQTDRQRAFILIPAGTKFSSSRQTNKCKIISLRYYNSLYTNYTDRPSLANTVSSHLNLTACILRQRLIVLQTNKWRGGI